MWPCLFCLLYIGSSSWDHHFESDQSLHWTVLLVTFLWAPHISSSCPVVMWATLSSGPVFPDYHLRLLSYGQGNDNVLLSSLLDDIGFKKALQIIFLVIFNSEFRIWLFLTNYTQSKPEIKWELGGVEQSLVWLSRKPSLILALREFEIIIIKWALKPRSEKILFFFFFLKAHPFI